MRLLLVEDDPALGPQLRERFGREGFAVDLADNGIDACHLGATEPYDLVILDLGLPRKSGMDVLRQWRADGIAVPVLVLTARDAWHERVDGIKAGADDYLGKPFHIEELIVRAHALLRRGREARATELRVAGFVLDETRQCLIGDAGNAIPLTGTEFRLLRYFLHHPGEVLSKSRLTEHVYEYDADRDSNVIEVYVRRLREKLGNDVIRTRRGQGYVLEQGA
ncbi:MAG: response regulator transcription factor [Chromatiales bacterium]|jgi:DNA-binding response OmpR family regulator|nr:response regulator transcription factor [Chromatiales bacterium]MDX9768228.1 response regulator transcription factor [Ectothiorhodospiraceae bacterium]